MATNSTLLFPAPSKQVAGEINGTKTDVTCISFADKIMITVTQHGRLAQWVCSFTLLVLLASAKLLALPPTSPSPTPVFSQLTLHRPHETGRSPPLADNPTAGDPFFHMSTAPEDALLPSTRFAPRTLLGAGTPEREMMGHLFASQIAHAITTKNPAETRSLMLGLGLAKAETEREVFCRLWIWY